MMINFGALAWVLRPIPLEFLKKKMLFFFVGTPSGVHLFYHLVWSIFQSSNTHRNYLFIGHDVTINSGHT